LIITVAVVTVFGLGLYLVVRYSRSIFPHDPPLQFLLFVSAVYIVSLLGKNYYDYLQFGRLLAINGRYLFFAILPIMVAMGMAYARFLHGRSRGVAAIVVLLCFLQGGGALTFIYDSNANWYWPNDSFALHINRDAQKVTKLFIIGKPRPKFW
jgi:hypothetical protein